MQSAHRNVFSPRLRPGGDRTRPWFCDAASKRNFIHAGQKRVYVHTARFLVTLLRAGRSYDGRRDDRRGKFTNLEPFFKPVDSFREARVTGDLRMISFPSCLLSHAFVFKPRLDSSVIFIALNNPPDRIAPILATPRISTRSILFFTVLHVPVCTHTHKG